MRGRVFFRFSSTTPNFNATTRRAASVWSPKTVHWGWSGVGGLRRALLHSMPAVSKAFISFSAASLPGRGTNSPSGSYPYPVTTSGLPPPHTWRTVIWFWVRVPLLSVQITETCSNVSRMESFLTRTPFWARRCTETAKERVTVAGRPSGIAATMIPNASMKASFIPRSTSTIPTAKTIAPNPRAINEMVRVSRDISCCKRLGSSRTAWVRRTIRPNWVSMPVA